MELNQDATTELFFEKTLGHWICPDGDMHPMKPVKDIWIKQKKVKGFFRNKIEWVVNLEFYDGEGWEWELDDEESAKKVRDKLIQIHFVADELN